MPLNKEAKPNLQCICSRKEAVGIELTSGVVGDSERMNNSH